MALQIRPAGVERRPQAVFENPPVFGSKRVEGATGTDMFEPRFSGKQKWPHRLKPFLYGALGAMALAIPLKETGSFSQNRFNASVVSSAQATEAPQRKELTGETKVFYDLLGQYIEDRRTGRLDSAALGQVLQRLDSLDVKKLESADQAYRMMFMNDARWQLHRQGRYNRFTQLGVDFNPTQKLSDFEIMLHRHDFPAPSEQLRRGGVGREDYEAALNYLGYVDLTTDQLIQFARGEYDRLETRMNELAKQADPGAKDWREVYDRLRQDHPEAGQVLDEYRKVAALAKQFLEERQLMSLPENDPLRIEETPIFWRSQIPFAAYSSFYKAFWVTIAMDNDPAKLEKALRDHCYACMAPIVVHEAYPGHHIQGMHQDNIRDTHDSNDPRTSARRFLERRVDWNTSYYKEGWGVYAEKLMAEEGFYEGDPGREMVAMRALLWRAARAMLDPMIHTGQISYEDAVDFMANAVVMDRDRAESEINRYYSRPTEVASYYLGMKQIEQLRDALKAQGKEFDAKAFHDRLMSDILPVPVLARLLFDIDLKPLDQADQ